MLLLYYPEISFGPKIKLAPQTKRSIGNAWKAHHTFEEARARIEYSGTSCLSFEKEWREDWTLALLYNQLLPIGCKHKLVAFSEF